MVDNTIKVYQYEDYAMKRWLMLLLSIGLLGMLSEGDASFGGAAAIRDGCVRMYDYIQRGYGDQFNQFWQDYTPDFNKPVKNTVVALDDSFKAKKQRSGKTFLGWNNRFKRPERRLQKHKKTMKPVYEGLCGEPVQERVTIQAQPLKQEQSSATDAVNALAQVLADKLSQVETRIAQKNDDKLEAFAERIERAVIKKKKKKHMPEMHYAQPTQPAMAPQMHYAQPVMPQQPMYQQPILQQNNMQQTAACAMQLQASAMAMQAQASAMMMQAQQQAVPVIQQSMEPIAIVQNERPCKKKMARVKEHVKKRKHSDIRYNIAHMPHIVENIESLSRSEKKELLGTYLKYIASSNQYDRQRVLSLLNTECDILEKLLSKKAGQPMCQMVEKRNELLKVSSSFERALYDLILSLATSFDAHDANYSRYDHYVRSANHGRIGSTKQDRRQFLMKLLYQIEKCYQMIKKIENQ